MQRLKDTWGLWAVVFLLTALLFVVMYDVDYGVVEQHVAGPRFVFYQVMLIEGICGIFVAWVCRRRFRWQLPDRVVVVFGLYVAGRWLWGEDMQTYRTGLLMLLAALYFIMRMLHSLSPQAGVVMQMVMLVVCFSESIYGLCQLYGYAASGHSIYRLTGSFFNPGPYAGFLAVISPVALNYVLAGNCRFRAKVCASVVFLLALSLFPATMSRSSWLALLAGCGIVLAVRYRVDRYLSLGVRRYRKRMILGTVAALLFVLIFVAGIYMLKKDSADGRWLIWKISLMAMQQQPVFGVGLGHFGGAYGQAQAAYFASGQASGQEEWVAGAPEYGFNEYLQIGVELGIAGLFLFVLLMVVTVRQLLRHRPQGWPGVLGGVVTFGVFACFSYPLSVLPLCILWVLLLAIAGGGGTEWSESSVGPEGEWRRRGAAGMVLGMGCVCLFATYAITGNKGELREAYVTWNEEQKYFNMNIYEGTVDNYQKLYPLLCEESRFLFEYGQCLSKTGAYEKSNRILTEGIRMSADPMFYNIMGKNEQFLLRYDRAESCFREAAWRVPNRLYPWYLLTRMYYESGQLEKGRRQARDFLDRKPKVMSEAVREMRREVESEIRVKSE